MFLIAALMVYIIDLSGFTESWKGWVSSRFGGRCRVGRPFDCSLCATWWLSLLYLIVTGNLSLPGVAGAGLVSYLTYPIGCLLSSLRDLLLKVCSLIDKLTARP